MINKSNELIYKTYFKYIIYLYKLMKKNFVFDEIINTIYILLKCPFPKNYYCEYIFLILKWYDYNKKGKHDDFSSINIKKNQIFGDRVNINNIILHKQ